jgi:hypothetical protein
MPEYINLTGAAACLVAWSIVAIVWLANRRSPAENIQTHISKGK